MRQPHRIGPAVIDLGWVGLEYVAVFLWIGLEGDRRVALRVALQVWALYFAEFIHRRDWREEEGIRNRVHLLVDAGGDTCPAAFGGQLVDVRHEEFDLAAEHAAGSVDFLSGKRRSVQMIRVVGHAIGRRE